MLYREIHDATPSHPMLIRRATSGDLEPLLALYRQLDPDDDPVDASYVASQWETMLCEDLPLIFIGELGGRLIASCTLVLVPNLTRGARPYGLIENVVTDVRHRGKGFGTTLLRHALDHAWAASCYKVMLLTGSRREQTLRFYENAGFQRGVKTGFVTTPPGPHRAGSG